MQMHKKIYVQTVMQMKVFVQMKEMIDTVFYITLGVYALVYFASTPTDEE